MSESQPPLPPSDDGVPAAASPSPGGYSPAGPAPAPAYAGSTTGAQYAGGPYTGGQYSGGQYSGGPYTGGPAAGPYTVQAPGTPPPAGSTTATGFFDSIRASRMVRPDDRVAAGVAAAVAGRMRVDPLLVRVGLVVLALVGGIGVLAYGLGWLLLPQQDGRIHAQALLAGSVTAGTIGAGATTLIGLGVIGPPWAWGEDPAVGGLIALASIVLLIVLFVVGNQRGWFGDGRPPAVPGAGTEPGTTADPTRGPAAGTTGPSGLGATRIDLSKPQDMPWATRATRATASYVGPPVPPVPPAPPVPFVPPVPPRPRRRTAGRMGTLLAVGLALLAAGAVVVADSIDPLSMDVGVIAWAVALAVIAACLLFLGLAGRRSGGLGVVAVIALIGLTGASVASEIDSGESTGRRLWIPTGQQASYDYQLSAGEAVLDLRQLSPSSGPPVEIRADVSVGELVVRVPDDLTVALDVTNGLGDVTGVGEGDSVIGPPGSADVNLDIDVSVGSFVLQEVSR